MGAALIIYTIKRQNIQTQSMNEVNKIISQHEEMTNKMKDLQTKMKKLDLPALRQLFKDINMSLSSNLKSVLTDQENQYLILEKIALKQKEKADEDEHVQRQLGWRETVLGATSTLSFIAQIVIIGLNPQLYPAAIIVAVAAAVYALIKTIQYIANSTKHTQELKLKKEQLIQYYKHGGQFQKDMDKLSKYTIAFVDTLHMLVVAAREIYSKLQINLNFLTFTDQTKIQKLDIKHCLDIIQKNPLNDDLEKACQVASSKLLKLKGLGSVERINQTVKCFDKLQSTTGILKIMQTVSNQLTDLFKNDIKILEEAVQDNPVKKAITTFQEKFMDRLDIKDKQSLIKKDQVILQDLLIKFPEFKQNTFKIAQVVAFFTTQFYGDDPQGLTVKGYDLKQQKKKIPKMNFMNQPYSQINLIELPKPTDPILLENWQNIRSVLLEQFKKANPGYLIQSSIIFIAIHTDQVIISGKKQNTIKYFYGIQAFQAGEFVSEMSKTYKIPFDSQLINNRPKTTIKQKSTVKKYSILDIPQMTKTHEIFYQDLTELCTYVSHFINVVAYPERITSILLWKEGESYKAQIKWAEWIELKPVFEGKKIWFAIEDLRKRKFEIPDPTTIFYEAILPQDMKVATFIAQ